MPLLTLIAKVRSDSEVKKALEQGKLQWIALNMKDCGAFQQFAMSSVFDHVMLCK